jgi:rare lipoprotein A
MKKYILLMLLLLFFGTTFSQITVQKVQIQKKDSTSKIIVVEKPLVHIDSMFVPKGKYKPFKKLAHASYYAEKFTGRKCASGRIFDNNKYYAAHKSLPFGTKLKVTNERNGKTVYVEVVDRGPFVKGRELDLSHRAFKDINPARGSGAVIVTIEILQK